VNIVRPIMTDDFSEWRKRTRALAAAILGPTVALATTTASKSTQAIPGCERSRTQSIAVLLGTAQQSATRVLPCHSMC